MASGDIHLIGSFLVFVAWYTFSACTLRDNPKSAILTSLPSQTRTFLAARSRCTNPLRDKNSYAKLKEGTFWSLLMKRKTMICEKGHQSITFNIIQIDNMSPSLYSMHVTLLVPFPSLSAMRTSLNQRLWEYHRHVSCQYHCCYSDEKYPHLCYCRWCTEKRKALI